MRTETVERRTEKTEDTSSSQLGREDELLEEKGYEDGEEILYEEDIIDRYEKGENSEEDSEEELVEPAKEVQGNEEAEIKRTEREKRQKEREQKKEIDTSPKKEPSKRLDRYFQFRIKCK